MRIKAFLFFLWCLFPLLLSATPHNIASLAKVSCSSAAGKEMDATRVSDGLIRILNTGEWRSGSRLDMRGRVRPFPWVQLDWDYPVNISQIILYDCPDISSHTAAGTLSFSDGTSIDVNLIANDGAPKVVDFDSKRVSWVRFQVTDGEGENLGLSEIEVLPSPESYSDYVSWVNPYVETAKGRYFFFVTGSLPFGMMSSAPLTRNINQGGGGYSYNSTRVLGFPQIHDWVISGLNLMPITGQIDTRKGESGWSSSFSHDGEIVQPGYHRLFLDRYGIWVEQTITERVGFYRLTYAQESLAKVLLGLGGHISTSTMVGAHASRVNETEIAGYFDTTGRVWGGVDKARVYFVVRFERPFRTLNSWTGNERQCDITQMNGSTEVYTIPGSSFKQSPTSGVEADFGGVKPGEQILVKTAFSYVSIENARENMDQECPHWDFEQVRTEALSVWNEWLGKIDVKGGTNQQKMKFYKITETMVRSGAVDIVIVDSVAALVPKAEIDGDMGDSHVGLQARLMSQALRKLTAVISKSNCVVIFINQLREKVGVMFGNPETTTGGRALKFYSSIRMDVRRVETLKQGGEMVGNHTRIKVVKNKVAPPFKQAEFDIMFGTGISKEGDVLDLAAECGIVNKSGAWYAYNGDKIGQGRENAKIFLKEHTDICDEIEKQVRIHYHLLPDEEGQAKEPVPATGDAPDASEE